MSSPDRPPRLVAIVGPTASGKSALALRAAARIGGEIVNCDSMQLIREMSIGTAKPTSAERSLVPHHLFDRISVDDFFSAGTYMTEARRICLDVARRGRVPLVVGGTGLYLRALLQGVFEGPGRCPPLRKRLDRSAHRHGDEFLHRLLKRMDPRAAERIPSADRIRIVRALEIVLLTGRPTDELRAQAKPLEGFQVIKLGFDLPRKTLYARIDGRVAAMFSGGLIEEVEGLIASGHSLQSKGFEAIGYRQAVAVIRGEQTLSEAVEEAARQSRRYAKRQMTWFRKEAEMHWITAPGETPEAWSQFGEIVKPIRD